MNILEHVRVRSAETSGLNHIQVQVCMLTYKRPELLRHALRSLLSLETHLNVSSFSRDLILHVLVVDNDSALTGCCIVEEFAAITTFPIRYVSEPARGLAKARNRALDESMFADFVAFIDDDEIADPNWLVQLMDVILNFKADVVTGPVHPQHQNTPMWMMRGGFFNSPRHTTGADVPFVATNNVLLSKAIANTFRFDPRFDDTGGEDTEYFMRVRRAGHKITWAQEAGVSEIVPAERANLRWLLSRARSDANRYTRSCLSFDRGYRTKLLRLITAGGGIVAGTLLLPSVIIGRHRAARGLQLIYRSIGTLTALRGKAQIYYKPIDDSCHE